MQTQRGLRKHWLKRVLKKGSMLHTIARTPKGICPMPRQSGTNVTGVSDRWPVYLQFEMYTKFVPKAKKWGTIYNAGDSNSLVHIKEMREAAKKLGVELIEATISISGEKMQG